MLDHHRTPAGILAATLTGAALFVSAPATAQGVHGAIAFGTETDQSNGVAYGFAWNFLAKDTAHAEAMSACISGGGTNCIQLAWFQDGCGALAMDQHGNAQGKPGMTREQAEARALQTCEAAGGAGCNIVGSLCTSSDGEPGTYSGSESVLPAQDAQTAVTGSADESPAHEEPVPAQDAQTVVSGPAGEFLAREERVLIQLALNALGFDAGPADGIFGPRTRSAIFEWQSASGHAATGYVTREQAEFLMAADATLDQAQEPRQETADNQSGNVLIFDPVTTQGNCTDEEALDAIGEYIERLELIVGSAFILKEEVEGNLFFITMDYFGFVGQDRKLNDPIFLCEGKIRVVNDCKLLNVKGFPVDDDFRRELSCRRVNW